MAGCGGDQMAEGEKEVLKFYANEGRVTLCCPKCGFMRQIEIAQLKSVNGPIKVKCRCQNVFHAQVEMRQFFRKQTSLPGEFTNVATGKSGRMVVKDVSIGGLGFITDEAGMLQPGDVLKVRFTLDDAHSSEILRKVTVRSVRHSMVGTEFSDGKPYDKDLGFYLRK
jgi:hypothetical protein